MTLLEETEIKLKKYEGLNDDNQSVLQISAFQHSEVLAIQGQSGQPRNTQGSYQIQGVTVARLNWKANLTCYECGERGI